MSYAHDSHTHSIHRSSSQLSHNNTLHYSPAIEIASSRGSPWNADILIQSRGAVKFRDSGENANFLVLPADRGETISAVALTFSAKRVWLVLVISEWFADACRFGGKEGLLVLGLPFWSRDCSAGSHEGGVGGTEGEGR